VVGAEDVLGAPLGLAVELVVLYAAGSYAIGRLRGSPVAGASCGDRPSTYWSSLA
jgi:hypothetical protein